MQRLINVVSLVQYRDTPVLADSADATMADVAATPPHPATSVPAGRVNVPTTDVVMDYHPCWRQRHV